MVRKAPSFIRILYFYMILHLTPNCKFYME